MVTGYGAGTPFGAYILFASIWLRSDYSTWQWLGQIIFAGVDSRTSNITTLKMPDETSMWETVDPSARAGPLNEADSTTWRPIVQNRHPKTNCQVGILGAHNGERPTKHDVSHVGRYWHRTGPSLHRPTHNQGSRSGRPWQAHTHPITQLRRSTNDTGRELRSGVKCIVLTIVTGSLWLVWRYRWNCIEIHLASTIPSH